MSDDTSKADTIAFHFYTKLFYTVNHARATEEARGQSKVDKWFNLETPDSDLFTREAREPYRSISQAPHPGPLPMEIQVLLSVPELTNNQALVYISPDSTTRVRIEPTPRFILLETWTLGMNFHHRGSFDADISPPVIYKHGIILFRSVFSLLRVLPSWKFHKRLKRGRNGNLGIQLRVRPSGESDTSILGFDERLSPIHRHPLPTSTHTFPPVPHLLGSFTLHTTYLSTPNFQLDELESLLSSRFISLDLEGFVPTLDKNKQRDSLSGSSLPNSSGIRSVLSRSPPRAIGLGRTASAGGGGGGMAPAVDNNPIVADRFILPTRVASLGAPSLGISASTGTTALIPPPRPFPSMNPNPSAVSVAAAQPIPAPSGLAAHHRLRRESMNSSSSSSISMRDNPYPNNPFSSSTAVAAAAAAATSGGGGGGGGTSSQSSSPISGALPIRRPHINPVHPFKSNTISSASGSSPSLSIRQGVTGAGAFVASGSPGGVGGIPHGLHSRQPSSSSSIPNNPAMAAAAARVPPSPIGGTGFNAVHPSPPGHAMSFTPSSLGDRRPGMSGSAASSDRGRERRGSVNSAGVGAGVVMGGGGDRDRDSDDGVGARVGVASPVPVPPPTRKRYSSSLGHRYVSSVGSATGAGVVGSASGSGISGNEGGRGGKVVERGSPSPGPGSAGGGSVGSVGGGVKKEGITALLGVTTTDDDDISIFVQHIDERKPLSSHDKEREKWDRDRDILEQQRAATKSSGQFKGRDREATDDTAATNTNTTATATAKGKERERPREKEEDDDDEDNARRRRFGSPGHDDAPYTTSPPPISGPIPASAVPVPGVSATATTTAKDEDLTAATAAAAAAALHTSTSPNRGPMLTSQDEVDERLKKMNENFLKSLEGIGASRTRRRGAGAGAGGQSQSQRGSTTTMTRDDDSSAATGSTSNPVKDRSESATTSSSSAASGGGGDVGGSGADNNNNDDDAAAAPASRFASRGLGLGFPSATSSRSSGGGRDGSSGGGDAYPSYPYNTPSLGLGLGTVGRGHERRHTSVSSSMLGGSSSDGGGAMASQGSEEVIGRMDLYEERRRSGFHGA